MSTINSWDDCPNPPVDDWRSNNVYIPRNKNKKQSNTSYHSYEAGYVNPNPSWYTQDYPQLSREALYGYDDPTIGGSNASSGGSSSGW